MQMNKDDSIYSKSTFLAKWWNPETVEQEGHGFPPYARLLGRDFPVPFTCVVLQDLFGVDCNVENTARQGGGGSDGSRRASYAPPLPDHPKIHLCMNLLVAVMSYSSCLHPPSIKRRYVWVTNVYD
jgi:hypothetical protein